ncbi:MAG: glycosyltransferase [Methylicorpusculum sp.]|uniref:nucleotide disphospho-sugar-binding domain-containing protein n=1 Tax=Methylicorpusculum sp. TaxID=2713644 RepID=UPI0027186456|nr:nucleotide disphospho-sugar-binding domain-containing protein [Methylicorpusculum sp.]MDO8938640.1 glycosyltransferase [Methylicorpusculum sp.]MDP2204318.1 glycosyltransferase [Methylicorpusculum sp.]
MSKILYAWELGGGYGHTAAFLPVAQQLKQQGHEVLFVLKNLEYASTLLGSDGFPYLQAPVSWPGTQVMPPPASYPGILKNIGYSDETGLYSRACAWQTLIKYLRADLLILDHAPTALLAARSLKTPRAIFGTGFYSPPRSNPMPGLRPWQPISENELIRTESLVLGVINSVLRRLGAEPLAMMADLFDVEENFLCTFPELDHYPQRNNAIYWGPSLYQSGGQEPLWPSIGDKKIFAYLKHDYPRLDDLLQQLKTSTHSVLVHIPGTTPAFIQRHASANLHISPQPVKLAEISRQCDLAICHGGAGTLAAFLLSGKPLLLLPLQLEQLLISRNVATLGAGICVASEIKKPNFRSLISDLLSHRKYTQVAEDFAKKYALFSPGKQALDICNRCETLAQQENRESQSQISANNAFTTDEEP